MNKKGDIRINNNQNQTYDGTRWRNSCAISGCTIRVKIPLGNCEKHNRSNSQERQTPKLINPQLNIPISQKGDNINQKLESMVIDKFLLSLSSISNDFYFERRASCKWDFVIHFSNGSSTMIQVKTCQDNGKKVKFNAGDNLTFKDKYEKFCVYTFGIQYYLQENNKDIGNVIITRIFLNLESCDNKLVGFSNNIYYVNSLEENDESFKTIVNFLVSKSRILDTSYKTLGLTSNFLIEYKCNMILTEKIPNLEIVNIDGNKIDAYYNNFSVQIKVLSKRGYLITDDYYHSYQTSNKNKNNYLDEIEIFLLVFRPVSNNETYEDISYVLVTTKELVDYNIDVNSDFSISTVGGINNWIWNLRNQNRIFWRTGKKT